MNTKFIVESELELGYYTEFDWLYEYTDVNLYKSKYNAIEIGYYRVFNRPAGTCISEHGIEEDLDWR